MKSILLASLICIISLNGKCQKQPKVHKTVNGIVSYTWDSPAVITFKSGLMIDADGAPKAYHKDDIKALDYLANAGKTGNWWALVTDNGKTNGKPIEQKATDPAPGYYISCTALQNTKKSIADPNRYANSAAIPYIALPPNFATGFSKGDIALVINKKNKKQCFAIFADIGPKNKLGEGSIYLAEQLGINSSPKNGGVGSEVLYILIKNSGKQKLLTNEEIQELGKLKISQAEIDFLLSCLVFGD